MTLVEFCKLHKIKQNTVSMYISNHKAEFEGHIIRTPGQKGVDLDDVAYQLLENKYPLPTKIEVVEDSYTRDQVLKLQEALLDEQKKVQLLQRQLIEKSEKIADLNGKALLLEDREHQIESKNDEIKKLTEDKDSIREKLIETEKKTEVLQHEKKDVQHQLEYVIGLPFWKRKGAIQKLKQSLAADENSEMN